MDIKALFLDTLFSPILEYIDGTLEYIWWRKLNLEIEMRANDWKKFRSILKRSRKRLTLQHLISTFLVRFKYHSNAKHEPNILKDMTILISID